MSLLSPTRRKVAIGVAAGAVAVGAVVVPNAQSGAYADVQVSTQSAKGADGKNYTVTNHLVPSMVNQSKQSKQGGKRKEWLLVWAGDENAADTVTGDIKGLPGTIDSGINKARNAAPGPDFLAVIDATKGSPTYGKVVNTATVGPLVENEPHHMQYVWHKGNKIYAGGLYSAATYVFDVKSLPKVKLSGMSLPTQTLGGSVPDAYWVTKDGNAYGTYMGGPVLPGPARYSDGSSRMGNGFAGTPGEVVRFDQTGKALAEAPASTGKPEDKRCLNLPQVGPPSCANPHGIQVREDLKTIVTSDYAEPRSIILDPVKTPSPYLRRNTVRTWDISNPNKPRVKSVSYLPKGPIANDNALNDAGRASMETTVTNQPGHKGAFVTSMQGGGVFYTPDITVPNPKWRLVYQDEQAAKQLDPKNGDAHGENGAWVQTSQDDTTLYHSLQGRSPGRLSDSDPGSTGGVYSLDTSKLVAEGGNVKCSIDTPEEAAHGGNEPDCPKLKSTAPINPGKPAGGPHWGALDNFRIGSDGYYHETPYASRMAVSNYFVARTGLDGDHRVNMVDIGPGGKLSVDKSFRDENTGQVGVNFNRKVWPHGAFGNAKPHASLFVVADNDVK
jgi:hypothetical protein